MKHRSTAIYFVLLITLMVGLACGGKEDYQNMASATQTAGARTAQPATQVAGEQAQAPANQQGESEAPTSGDEDDSTASLVEGTVTPGALNLPSLGRITFSVNTDQSASVEYPADGSEVSLEVTDGAGLTWKLTLPGNALYQPQTIKMTALTGLQSSDVPLKLLGGVQLEPDGLEFYEPAVLSVSGADLGEKVFLLTGQQDGSEMDLTLPGEQPGSAQLYHFSTVVTGNADEQETFDKWGKQLDEADKAAIQEAKELLKNKDIQVPVPPSISVECGEDEKKSAAAIDAFYKAVMEPEVILINKLLAIKKGNALLSRSYDEAFQLENRLLGRLVKKARLLIKQYYGQPEKLLPVAKVALKIAYNVQLLSTDGSGPLFLEDIGNWADKSIDLLLEEVITKHDYKKVDAVWTMARWAALLGVQNHSVEQIQRKLEGALLFQLKSEYRIKIVGDQEFLANGEFEMRYRPQEMKWGMLTGNGKINFIHYVNGQVPEIQTTAPSFPVNAIITKFDACAGTATLTIDRYYPDSESYVLEGETWDMPMIKNSWLAQFSGYKGSGTSWLSGEAMDMYTFQMTLRNLQETAVEQTFDGDSSLSQGKLTSTFTVKLVHKPKRFK